MQRLIVLRGCMGSGKTSVAKKFRNFSQKCAHIKVDDFKHLFEHAEKETRPIFHGAAIGATEYLLKEGYSVVLEGVFQKVEYVEQAVQVAEQCEVPCRVFELTASLDTLTRRDASRKEVKSGIRQPLGRSATEAIASKLANNPYTKAVKIDTERMTINAVVEKITAAFDFSDNESPSQAVTHIDQ